MIVSIEGGDAHTALSLVEPGNFAKENCASAAIKSSCLKFTLTLAGGQSICTLLEI